VGDWIRPEGASTSSRQDARRGMTISRTWEVSVPVGWPAYQEHLRGAPWLGYHERESTSTRESFSRLREGDMFMLTLDLLSPGPPIRVRVNLTAMPD